MENPFRPGTAARPPHLAGRDTELGEALSALSSHGNSFESFNVFYGPRGLGKTVFLKEIVEQATERRWATISFEAARGAAFLNPFLNQLQELGSFPKRVSDKIKRIRTEWAEQEQQIDLKVFRRTARRNAPPTLPIREQFLDTMIDVVGYYTDRAGGLCVTIDEAQQITPAELSPLGPLVQELSSRPDQSIYIALAGLSDLPTHLDASFTYSERWAHHRFTMLEAADVIEALALPAAKNGRPFTSAALSNTHSLTNGYPFAVQLLGRAAWAASEDADHITEDHIVTAAQQMTRQLEEGIFTKRWTVMPSLAKRYMAAAAFENTHQVSTTAISARLNKTTSQMSSVRAALIANGDLISRSHGTVEETIPGMFNYIRSRSDAEAHLEAAAEPAIADNTATSTARRQTRFER